MSEGHSHPGRWCPSCGSPWLPGDLFCESCGAEVAAEWSMPANPPAAAAAAPVAPLVYASGRTHRLEPGQPEGRRAPAPPPPLPGAEAGPRPCAACGGSFREGWCTTCGAKQLQNRDHLELEPAGWVAGVCDRGIRHTRNDDAVAVAVGPGSGPAGVLVVCDGVSSAEHSDIAALTAAHVACETLVTCAPAYSAPISTKILFWTGQLHTAAASAQAAAVSAAPGRGGNPPSCTFAAAVTDGPLVVAGWIGDSRIYWLPDTGPAIQLSVDHSWAAEQIAMGVPRQVAENDSMAHAITRWLGADSPDPRPVCATALIDSPGWLLVCSDGLWNYCSQPEALDALVSATAASCGGRPIDVARGLVDWANRSGGQDNISVALARLPVPRSQAPTPAVASSLTGSS